MKQEQYNWKFKKMVADPLFQEWHSNQDNLSYSLNTLVSFIIQLVGTGDLGSFAMQSKLQRILLLQDEEFINEMVQKINPHLQNDVAKIIKNSDKENYSEALKEVHESKEESIQKLEEQKLYSQEQNQEPKIDSQEEIQEHEGQKINPELTQQKTEESKVNPKEPIQKPEEPKTESGNNEYAEVKKQAAGFF
ncbi:hypothetical protein [Bacillus cereus]|uniref:hypothetical protein n=1 Tax=Bacillus cereus TaxID=1396 RepID=UPI00016B584D|nr:hypothetical protein [Bacillus cereus]EDZ49875.1 EF hand family protein, putative [Bacillus cereus AH1134]